MTFLQWLLRLIRRDMEWSAGEMRENRDMYQAVTEQLQKEHEQQWEPETTMQGKDKEG